MTLEELQAKREEILKAIGIARVQFGDRSLQYVEDKKRELALIDEEIAKAAATKSTRHIRSATAKGLYLHCDSLDFGMELEAFRGCHADMTSDLGGPGF